MPVHDWSRVHAEIFHSFQLSWISHLKQTLNNGFLPPKYYAISERHAGYSIEQLLALPFSPPPQPAAQATPLTLAIRHEKGHRIIALVEIVSPANKDEAAHVVEFADKAEAAILRGINVMLVDLFPPGRNDPHCIHEAIWERFGEEPHDDPTSEPLTLVSYVASPRPEAYLEYVACGSPLIDMPLFLGPEHYLNIPLESTYLAAYQGMPSYWREVLEGRRQLPE